MVAANETDSSCKSNCVYHNETKLKSGDKTACNNISNCNSKYMYKNASKWDECMPCDADLT